jgi:GNAT superfamily N-acetyltransferase
MRSDAVSSIRIRRAEPSDIDVLAAIDDDATMLFAEAELDVDFPADHEFVIHERRRWRACIVAGTTLVAVDARRGPVGFAMLGRLDGIPYLEQLSVTRESMRCGIGTGLLRAASAMTNDAGERAIQLTTYAHLRWNRAFYALNGYDVLPDDACGVELAGELALQRRWLPHPEQRIAMRCTLRGAGETKPRR